MVFWLIAAPNGIDARPRVWAPVAATHTPQIPSPLPAHAQWWTCCSLVALHPPNHNNGMPMWRTNHVSLRRQSSCFKLYCQEAASQKEERCTAEDKHSGCAASQAWLLLQLQPAADLLDLLLVHHQIRCGLGLVTV